MRTERSVCDKVKVCGSGVIFGSEEVWFQVKGEWGVCNVTSLTFINWKDYCFFLKKTAGLFIPGRIIFKPLCWTDEFGVALIEDDESNLDSLMDHCKIIWSGTIIHILVLVQIQKILTTQELINIFV